MAMFNFYTSPVKTAKAITNSCRTEKMHTDE